MQSGDSTSYVASHASSPAWHAGGLMRPAGQVRPFQASICLLRPISSGELRLASRRLQSDVNLSLGTPLGRLLDGRLRIVAASILSKEPLRVIPRLQLKQPSPSPAGPWLRSPTPRVMCLLVEVTIMASVTQLTVHDAGICWLRAPCIHAAVKAS